MTHFKRIYSQQAHQYQQLVTREDYQGNLPETLAQIQLFDRLEVIDMGAGTGRLTRLVAPQAKRIVTCDISPHMLSVARIVLAETGFDNWDIAAADNRRLPFPDQSADLVMAGWSLGHSVGWYPGSWQIEIGRALAEMERVSRPGGTIIILETLGTNQEVPQPPTPGHGEFYRWLEGELGFEHIWIRTDYRFASVQEAAELTRFFFGEEMAADVLEKGKQIVPECTGIWWRSAG
jgi:ubiquinone/menaquinone biosynthesis C-methylase UbiE